MEMDDALQLANGSILLRSKYLERNMYYTTKIFMKPVISFFASGSNIFMVIYALSKNNCQMF
jgi:hypothetical protein